MRSLFSPNHPGPKGAQFASMTLPASLFDVLPHAVVIQPARGEADRDRDEYEQGDQEIRQASIGVHLIGVRA